MRVSLYLCRGVVAACFLTLTSSITAVAMPADDGEAGMFSTVANPRIPANVEICGQRVNLDDMGHFERFDRELTSLAYTHGSTLLMIKRANRYFPQIAPILRQNGMPEDLLYLACVESSLNPRAISGAKAGGIWQFMPSTAKEYGLEVSDEVDERFNIEKATVAACKYFKTALKRYGGDWISAMASYNTGMGRVTKQLDEQLVDSAVDLYLSDETMRYPFRVMAMKAIMEHPAQFGYILTADQLYQPRQIEVVEVSGAVESWAKWAVDHGTTYLDLREENPWIRAPKLTNAKGKTYRVRVPKKGTTKRSAAHKSVYNSNWIAK